MKIEMKNNELWYGGGSRIGTRMPLSVKSNETFDLRINPTPNQAASLFLSNQGRFIYGENGFQINFKNGFIEYSDQATLYQGFDTLKGAYLEAQKFFPPSGMPSAKLFEQPIYNTWIELTFFQNQADVLNYANNIINAGLPAGTLMIDDGWSECYGDWQFHSGKFPQPKQMIEELHRMGFSIMLWVSPFITPDSVAFRQARDRDFLLKNQDGTPFVTSWWNGYSCLLDLSNPLTEEWLSDKLSTLLELGIDGFKFDGGDSIYYADKYSNQGQLNQNQQSLLWAQFASKYTFNELRVSFNGGGLPLLQRLCDKEHSWGDTGIVSLVPDSLLAGIIGSPFTCPDMIGGGEYLNFQENTGKLDHELFIRHAEIAALMPAIQFSSAPWRVLNDKEFAVIQTILQIRQKYLPYLMQVIDETAHTGEPVLRYMEYEFPHQEMGDIIDQYMMGSDLLVTPITTKDTRERQVVLPRGRWKYQNRVFEGGTTHNIKSDLGETIIFVRDVKQ